MKAVLRIVLPVMLALFQAAHADDILGQVQYFNVPAGALDRALVEFGRQARVEVSADGEVVRGYRTGGVQGRESVRSALVRLLGESGLTFQVVGNTVQVRATEAVYVSDGTRPQTARLMGQVPLSQSSRTQAVSDKEDGVIAEVVVTAQKREERLVETPISIGVFSGASLEQSSSRGVADVLNQIGGVAVTEIQPGRTEIAVRGVVPGTSTNTTAYYIDEVPFSFIRIADQPDVGSFDLQRIEVLRGPQGTLYGANSLSGVVRILTNDANVDSFEAKARARVSTTDGGGGNYGGDLAVNVPLIPDELAVRGVASYSDMSGFIDSRFDGKTRINDSTNQDYRFKVTWQPTQNFSARLAYLRSEAESGAPMQALDDLTTPFSSEQADERVLDAYNLVAEYRWPNVTLMSSTGYIGYSVDAEREILLGGGFRIGYLNLSRLNSFSQELRLSSNIDGPWRWSAGASYADTTHKTMQDARPIFPGIYIEGAVSESYAVFGDVTRLLADDKLELTAGVRYYQDEQTIQDLGSFDPSATLLPDESTDFDKTTGRIVLAYKPSEASMFYGSVVTGFRSGTLQSQEVLRVAPGFPSILPDTLLSYELGTKGYLFDNTFSYETAVYYTDWKDIQQSLILPIGFTARVNAGGASGLGVDMTIAYQPLRALTLNLNLGWNDLTFDEDVFNFDAGSGRNVLLFPEGSRLNDSPEWTGSVGATYRAATPMQGTDFVLSANHAYGSRRLLRFLTAGVITETQSDVMRQLKVTLGMENDRWSVELFGDNLLNEEGAVTAPDINVAGTAVRLRPRTIGLQAAYRMQD